MFDYIAVFAIKPLSIHQGWSLILAIKTVGGFRMLQGHKYGTDCDCFYPDDVTTGLGKAITTG